ncbi:pilus assembly PilX family protein [Oceanospirillum maris]|uniref:pilus assembly PilX family protein n=1 Tax=Oceanospirillum maris TaxID=64977 RepID=UPI00048A0290|nr:PilX N-terminal domain-containing pilus assembly protein [Oceanospirillum maris]
MTVILNAFSRPSSFGSRPSSFGLNKPHLKHNRPLDRQQGMVTLMFAMVLLVALTMISFLTARTLLTEQTISANEYRSKEASYAAEAALEYGIAWLDQHHHTFAIWNASDENSDAVSWNDLNADNIVLTRSGDHYQLTVSYTRACLDDPNPVLLADCNRWIIDVAATAVAMSDSDLTRTQWIRVLSKPNAVNPAITDFIRIPGSWRDWP